MILLCLSLSVQDIKTDTDEPLLVKTKKIGIRKKRDAGW